MGGISKKSSGILIDKSQEKLVRKPTGNNLYGFEKGELFSSDDLRRGNLCFPGRRVDNRIMSERFRSVEFWATLLSGLRPAVRHETLQEIDLENPPDFQKWVFDGVSAAIYQTKRVGSSKLLLDSGLLAHALAMPELLTMEEALGITKMVLAIDARFDVQLLQQTTSPERAWPEGVTTEEMARVLDLLRLTVGVLPRTAMMMRRFLRVKEPKIRARAVKLLAKAQPVIADEFLRDADPRVRANLLEALLSEADGLPGSLRGLADRCSFDSHHRVMSTALLYLALADDATAEARLKALENHPSSGFRKAGHWAVGKLMELRRAREAAKAAAMLESAASTA